MTTETLPIDEHIRSEMLGDLPKIQFLKDFLGTLAQFNVVVDTNIILGDLIWLVGKRKNPDATTELMECIRAGTIVAYVTRSILAEVNEHITTIATTQSLSEATLRTEWKAYRKLLKVRTPRKALVARYENGQDPDDAPTIALEKMLKAVGILSKDSDLVAMGGIVIELDFTKQARDYSRKTAIAATIRVSAGVVTVVGWGAINIAFESIRGAATLFGRLPPAVQVLILIAALAIGSNRSLQERVATMIQQTNASFLDHWPAIAAVLAAIGTTLAENTVSPPQPTLRMPKNRAIHNKGLA
jgi:putative PIN family toxin of toxin-antitoxin system